MTTSRLIELVRTCPRIYIIGNGGSYANAMHGANDLLSCGIRAFTMDVATFSAFANDHGYYRAFEEWIEIVGERGDLLIALSGSGKSPNILKACEAAETIGMKVWRIFGADLEQDMQTAEQHQIQIFHELLRALKK